MTLSQRPASRFFAAFYRYNRIAHQSHICPRSATLAQHDRQLPALLHPRRLHTTRFLRQQEQEIPQDQDAKGTIPPEDGAVFEQVYDDLDTEAEKLKSDVRQLMRKVPSSVAVVTVYSYDAELTAHVPMGVAVSSFSTVSLDPPTVSFNIKEPSRTLEAIRAADGLFRVHFPAADRGGATMVDVFARGNHPKAYIARTKALGLYVPGHGSFMDRRRATASKAPQIYGDYVRASMECTLVKEVPVADHVILVARVDSLESKRPDDSTILYLDGSYMLPNGDTVNTPKEITTNFDATWYDWEHPLFGSEEERLAYMEQIRAIVKTQTALQQTTADIRRHLTETVPLNPGAWGINIEQLVDEVRREAGCPTDLPAHLQDTSVLSDFYGRLTQADRAKITNRMHRLVSADPEALAFNFRKLLQLLEVSTFTRGVLPSDIAGPLRAEGLIGPFQPRTGNRKLHTMSWTLEYVEQVEHNLIEYYKELGYEKALVSRLEVVVKSMGENAVIASYFQKCRFRLLAAAAPKLFHPSQFDISGDISPEEARVVMSRYVKFLQPENLSVFRRNMNMNIEETLRFCKIHPYIAGFNVEFFVGKMKHLYFTTRYARDAVALVREMLAPYFAKTVSWDDLDNKVRELVKKMPWQTMSFTTRDKLAAMGLDWEVVLDVPASNNMQLLNDGQILDTLVAKELKGLYVDPSDALSQAIHRYLKKQYNFDVDPAHTEKLEALPPTSSADAGPSVHYGLEQARAGGMNLAEDGEKPTRPRVDVYGTGQQDLAGNGEGAMRPRIRGYSESGLVEKRASEAEWKPPRWHRLREKGEAKRKVRNKML